MIVGQRVKSDFGLIADYFSERDKTDFGLDKREIRHPEEVLDLLAAFADERYGTIKEEIRELVRKGGRVSMCNLYEKYFQRGKSEGRSEGRTEGRSEGRLESLITQICKKLQKGKSTGQIADEIEESVSFVEQVLEVAKEFAPEYDSEKVCRVWWEKNEKIAG